jgi:hypothetical protein
MSFFAASKVRSWHNLGCALIQHGKIPFVDQSAAPEYLETTMAFFLMKKARRGDYSGYGKPVSA